MKVEYAGYAGACQVLIVKKKSVAGQFAAVKSHSIGQKRIAGLKN
jgi:hypothetical protein